MSKPSRPSYSRQGQRGLRRAVHIAWKSALIIVLVALYLLVSLFMKLIPLRRKKIRRLITLNSRFFSKWALRILGIKVSVFGQSRRTSTDINYCVISNHVSSIDILIIASIMPAIFVTSMELKSGLTTGIIARAGGSIYVERRSIGSLKREIEEITAMLKSGFTVVIFPEGTTSSGERVMPFKISLFQSAVRSSISVLPICLRYRTIDGESITASNRDSIYYYGGQSFIRHVLRVLALGRVNVDAIFLERISPGAHSRKDLAAEAHRVISKAYLNNI